MGIPAASQNKLKIKENEISYEKYLQVTDEIFSTALANTQLSIGGKTTTIVRYYSDINEYRYSGIKGFRTITHYDDEYQDVSTYTDLDIRTGQFFLRDMRREGRIVSHIDCKNGEYRFHYDSCSTDFGKDDEIYRKFSAIDIRTAMKMEL